MYPSIRNLFAILTVSIVCPNVYSGDLVAPDITVCVNQDGGIAGEFDGLITYQGKPFPGNDYSPVQINLYLMPAQGSSYPFSINNGKSEKYSEEQLFYDNDPLSDPYPYWEGTGLRLPSGIPLGVYTVKYTALTTLGANVSDNGVLTIQVDEACQLPKVIVAGLGSVEVSQDKEADILIAGGALVVSTANASPSESVIETTVGSTVDISTNPITKVTTAGATMDIGGAGGSVSTPCNSVMPTRLKYTDEASCYFVIMANNYDFITEGMETRLSGTIPTPLAQEDQDEEGSSPSVSVDPNSPLAEIFTFLNNTSQTFHQMQPQFQKTIVQLGVSYKNTFNEKLIINSAFRSPAYQKILFDQAVAKYGSVDKARKWVAPPGRSMHNKGLAIDINYHGKQLDKAEQAGFFPEFGVWRPMRHETWHAEPEMTRFLRNGTKSAYTLDQNITTKNSHAIGNTNERTKRLTEKFKTLGMYSRYAQELGFMTTEMLIGRNQLKKREQIDERVKKELEGGE